MASKFLDKYKRCILEYTNIADAYNISEDGEEMPQDGMTPDQGMGQDMAPGMGGEMDSGMGGEMDPGMGGEMDPGMGGGEMAPPADGMPMDNSANGVEGFNPEGVDETMPMDGMGSQDQEGVDTMQPEDEIIDVDDLTKSQETAEKKIDKMNAKFEKLMGAMEALIKQNAEREAKAAEAEAKLKSEIEKRMPTPQQRMSMRSTKSSPYSMTPNEYMNNYAPENYSDADDNNGADDMQYEITKGDIDNFTDYKSIAKELDVDHQSLQDILGDF